ncbi:MULTISPECIES: PH domain-containing protein [Kordiimonas]|jgi:putative membrane protein|uniref:PH domain-containing protein n=1 Tax=Kordiimonas TaxID=288021 RepID=UPI00257FF82E|nr:PH domain-containing protein [Kordiimonas sp. UBA4487]
MTAPEQQAATLESLSGEAWNRLAPAAIIHFIIKFVIGFAKNGIQNVAYLGGIAIFTGDNRWFILGAIAAVAGAALLVGGILSYLNFRFRLDGQTFLIHRGVLNKKRLTLSFDRIQNVVVKEPFYFRPFGLVALALESAGSSDEEVSLAGIPTSLAQDIRRAVLERRSKPAATAPTSERSESEGPDVAPQTKTEDSELLLAQPVSELARYGLSNNNIWVVAGIAVGAIFQQFDAWEEDAEAFIEASVIPVTGDDSTILGLLFAAGLLTVLLLLTLFSVIGAIIVYYRFRLLYADGRYHRETGLFERLETSVPETKVQSLQINQPWPALLLGRWHLVMKQVGFGGTNNPAQNRKSNFIIPSVLPAFYQALSNRLFGQMDWQTMQLRAISRFYVWKTVFYFALLPAMLATIPLAANVGMAGLAPLLLPFLAIPFVILRHARFGYWSDGKVAVVRQGFVGTRMTVFPFHKAQTVSLTQSPSQRRWQLATLKVQLAGQTLTIPYMPLADAEAWRDRILYEVETSRKAWM